MRYFIPLAFNDQFPHDIRIQQDSLIYNILKKKLFFKAPALENIKKINANREKVFNTLNDFFKNFKYNITQNLS